MYNPGAFQNAASDLDLVVSEMCMGPLILKAHFLITLLTLLDVSPSNYQSQMWALLFPVYVPGLGGGIVMLRLLAPQGRPSQL